MFFYENIGTPNYPTFSLVDPNYLLIPDRGWKSIYPNFADWDNDGDFDLLVGDQDGLIHLFVNSGSVSAPEFDEPFEILNDVNQVIDVGQFAAPQLIDLDEDGLKDLVVGEKNGNINLYRNIGDETTNIFTLLEDSIGDVVATNILGIDGYSIPYFFKNESGTWELLLGSETGQINHYDQIEGNFFGDFNLITEEYQGINEGLKCAIAMGDITGDGIADLFYGNIGGGIALYLSEEFIIGIYELSTNEFRIFPNPTVKGGELILEFKKKDFINEEVTIFDISGKKVWSQKTTSSLMHIPCQFERGMYLIQAGNSVSKWIVE
ncbi:MAG: T9SS type A sorting domain-containing protein [Flavobacteriales bacterium]